MIRKIKEDEVHEVSKFVWQVYQDESKRTTPPYHNLEHVVKTFERTFKADNYLIGVYDKVMLIGVALICLEEKDRYFSLQGPYILNTDKYNDISNEILTYLEDKYRGFSCHFGTTKPNVNAQAFLESNGFACTDDTIQMAVTDESLIEIRCKSDIQLLDESRMGEYKLFHDRVYHDYYFLADRIYANFSKWKIHLLLVDNNIIGSVFTMRQSEDSGEIYGCHILEPYKSNQNMSELFYVSTKSWMYEGVKKIVNFVPEGVMSESAGMVGYKAYDTYMCFYKEVL